MRLLLMILGIIAFSLVVLVLVAVGAVNFKEQ